jgi:tRNA1(Val) A37 N6-methylase TrmN6
VAEGAASESRDALLDGRLVLRQPARGHRAGTDAVLLAAAAPAGAGDLVDAGAGVGTAGLAVALRDPGARARLVERDPELARFALANVAGNDLCDRVAVVVADFLKPADRRRAGLADSSADCVLCNPPFYEAGSVRVSPDAGRAAAHVAPAGAGDGAPEPWLRAVAAVLRPGGTVILIHRAAALDAVLAACRGRFGALAVLPIHPRAGAGASRVLLRGTKGSRAPLRLLPGLVLHAGTGAFTAQAEAIHRGRALIGWDDG